MSERRMIVFEPPRLDSLRLRSADYTMRATSPAGPVLVHYDPVQQVGAVLFLSAECWAIYGPLAFDGFVRSLQDRQITAPDSDDLATWVAACTPPPMADELN